MKKYLLSFVSLFMVTLFAAAQDSEPVEKLFADGKYYIQNVESGLYWGVGNDWGTRASLVKNPAYVTLIGNEDGTYQMETQVSNGGTNYYFGGDYMDGSPVNLTIAQAGDYYTIAQGESYFGYDATSTILGKNQAADAKTALWKIISEEELQASLATATAEAPVDATFLILDPNFGRNNRNQSAWTVSEDCTNKNLSGGNNTNNCAESFHSVFTISQVIENVPAGIYKLTAQGFYRQDGEDNENLPQFFANDETSPFPLKTGSENSMSEASVSFAAGNYAADPIFFELAEGETLTIGAKLEENANLWCIWDNFELTYYGAEADINSIKFADLIEQVATLREQAGELQSNENISTVTMRSLQMALQGSFEIEQTEEAYKTAIAALDAAVKQANADITNKAAIDGMYAELEATNVYTAEAYETYKALVDGYKTSFDAGELTETVVNPQALAGWHSANTIDDLLLSAWSIGGEQAKDYDKALYINTWSVEGDNDGTNFHVPFFEYWTGDGNSLGANTLTATVEGVEPGQYDVTAWVRVRAKNGYTAPAYGITLDVNGGDAVDVAAGEQIGTSQFYLAEFKAQGEVAEDGVLKINFNVAEDNNISWLSFKNVKYAVTPTAELSNFAVVPATALDEDGDLKVTVTFDAALTGAYAENSWILAPTFEFDILQDGNVVANGFATSGDIEEGSIYGNVPGLAYGTEYTVAVTKASVMDLSIFEDVFVAEEGLPTATFTIPVPAVVLNVPTFNIEEGTQAEPNLFAVGENLKITYTADNLEVNGINADDVQVKVTVMVSGDLPENQMAMSSETAHTVRGESFYIPLGETDFPVALKEGYIYQNVAVMAAELVKPATEEGAAEEVIATYAGAPVMCHWIGVEAPEPEITYVYTDLTDDMFHSWSTTDATAEITGSVPDVDNFENNIGKEVGAGGVVYGTGTVYYLSYAALADYDVMKIERASTEGGTPRLLFGRLTNEGGEYIEIQSAESEYVTASEDGLTWIIDLNKIKENKEGLANLNVIKSSWGGPVTINSIQLGKVAGEEPTETTFDIAFERIENQGYTAENVEYDEAAILEALGLEEWNGIEIYPVVITTGEAGEDHDGWRNVDGDPEGWNGDGTGLGLCLKYPHDGSMTLCTHPGNDPAAGSELTAAWLLKANDKSVILNVTVTFVKAPAVEITLSDKVVKASVDYTVDEASYAFRQVDLTDEDVATILAETGLTDITKATPLGYNPTTGELLTMFDGYDGWRDANGDFHNWTGNSTAPACVKVYEDGHEFTGRNFYCYNIGGCAPQTIKTYWALAGETKAVLVEISFTYTPGTSITSLSTDNADIEAVYTIGGAQLQGLQKGMNIVKYADGSVKKVFVK